MPLGHLPNGGASQHWAEVTASSLIGVDEDGNVMENGNLGGEPELSAKCIHLGIRKVRPDANVSYSTTPFTMKKLVYQRLCNSQKFDCCRIIVDFYLVENIDGTASRNVNWSLSSNPEGKKISFIQCNKIAIKPLILSIMCMLLIYLAHQK